MIPAYLHPEACITLEFIIEHIPEGELRTSFIAFLPGGEDADLAPINALTRLVCLFVIRGVGEAQPQKAGQHYHKQSVGQYRTVAG